MTEQEWKEEFAYRLRKYSYRAGYKKQKQLAEEMGLTEATISRYRNSSRTPDIITIVNIAAILQCDINDLVPTGEMVER